MEVENADRKILGDALATSFNDFEKSKLIEDAGKPLRWLWITTKEMTLAN